MVRGRSGIEPGTDVEIIYMDYKPKSWLFQKTEIHSFSAYEKAFERIAEKIIMEHPDEFR